MQFCVFPSFFSSNAPRFEQKWEKSRKRNCWLQLELEWEPKFETKYFTPCHINQRQSPGLWTLLINIWLGWLDLTSWEDWCKRAQIAQDYWVLILVLVGWKKFQQSISNATSSLVKLDTPFPIWKIKLSSIWTIYDVDWRPTKIYRPCWHGLVSRQLLMDTQSEAIPNIMLGSLSLIDS